MNEEKDNPEYQRGFNEGYSVSQYDPEIGEILSKASGNSNRLDGFKEGRRQYLTEQVMDKRPTWLQPSRTVSDKGKEDKSRNKDISPEK